jgi:hypothetical protein
MDKLERTRVYGEGFGGIESTACCHVGAKMKISRGVRCPITVQRLRLRYLVITIISYFSFTEILLFSLVCSDLQYRSTDNGRPRTQPKCCCWISRDTRE